MRLRPPHITCGICQQEFLFGEGYTEHIRSAHGWLTIHKASGGIEYVPILSHPEQQEMIR